MFHGFRHSLVLHLVRLGLVLFPLYVTEANDSAPRPNVLFAIADDQSFPHTSAYGTKGVNTPAFDRVAKAGVLFQNGFCASPGCSPSRAALLTGKNTWQLEQAGTHASEFPKKFQVYPDLLEEAGYHVGYTGKGWGPGNYKASGRDRNPAGPAYQQRTNKAPKGISNNDYAANFGDFLEAKPKDKPFCFWLGATEPHRAYEKGSGLARGKELSSAEVPPFLPNLPEIQSDLLDYFVEIEWFDNHLGRTLDLLEQRGELENTIIIVTADNGMPFPRAKANCYEHGIHVPLAISWPAQVPAGRVVNDVVGFIDLAPTMLAAAGISPPADMAGKSLMNVLKSDRQGQVDPTRTRAFAARERHSSSRYDNWTYPIRAMRTDRYLYVINFRPDRWPAGDPSGFKGDAFGYYDIDGCPSKTFLWENRADKAIAPYFHWAVDRRPLEELYDVKADPGNLKNLAHDPARAELKQQLDQELRAYLRKTGDPRVIDGGDIYETYRRYSAIRTFPSPDAVQKD